MYGAFLNDLCCNKIFFYQIVFILYRKRKVFIFIMRKKVFIMRKKFNFCFRWLDLGKVYREVVLIENHNLNFSRVPSFVQFFVVNTFEVYF